MKLSLAARLILVPLTMAVSLFLVVVLQFGGHVALKPQTGPKTGVTLSKPANEAAFKAARASYLDKAWKGFQELRYKAESNEWTGAGITNALALAYACEALERNAPLAWERIRKALASSPAASSMECAVFTGMPYEQIYGVLAADQNQASLVLGFESQPTLELLKNKNLKYFFQRQGSSSALASFSGSLMKAFPAENVKGTDLVLILDFLTWASEQGISLDAAAYVEKILNTLTVKNSSGYFLYDPARQAASIPLSLDAAWCLRSLGASNAKWAAWGYSLGVSSMALADEQGMLPQFLLADQAKKVSFEGLVFPEDVYFFVHTPRFVPHYSGLGSNWGNAAWTLSFAAVKLSESSPRQAQAESFFLAGFPCYFISYGFIPQNLAINGVTQMASIYFDALPQGYTFYYDVPLSILKFPDTEVNANATFNW